MRELTLIPSTHPNLLLYSYPIIEETKPLLAKTQEDLDYIERVSHMLYNLHLFAGDSMESEQVKRIMDAYKVMDSMKKTFRDYQLIQSNTSSIENRYIFVAANTNLIVQSMAHTFFDKESEGVKIGHLVTAPWNLPSLFSSKLPHKSIKGAGTLVLENAISHMHKLYPTHEVLVEKTPPTAVPFLRKKIGFKVVEQNNKFCTMSLSKNKAATIASKVLKGLK